MIKTIDRLLIKSFIPPFIMAYFIAVFVLVMQFLWKYIDDIVGKGLEVWVILELLFYLTMTLVPMALPIGILIASVMVMGNLAEKYELASMKSAGIPLSRVMAPLMAVCFVIMGISFVISNNVIPYSNLKFHSRLYDIRKQRPALSLEEGTFNDDFKDVVIRIGNKDNATGELNDVMIYDHSNARRQENNQIIAKTGEMFVTGDDKYLVLSLQNGKHYQDAKRGQETGETDNYPFIRTTFDNYEKIFDMSEFDLNRTDEDLFRSHQRMLSARQLSLALDSIDIRMSTMVENLRRNTKAYFYFRRTALDSGLIYMPLKEEFTIDTTLTDFGQMVPQYKRGDVVQKAVTLSRRIQDYSRSAASGLEKNHYSRVVHLIELHRKFTFAFACFMFLFIGAPMGAIVRKGGFGWPILIAISFFMTFIVFVILGEKLAKEMVVGPIIGTWLPCLILFPIGALLTYLAMNDSKLLSSDGASKLKKRLIKGLQAIRALGSKS